MILKNPTWTSRDKKNTISEMRNTLDGINSKFDSAEEIISELEDIEIE